MRKILVVAVCLPFVAGCGAAKPKDAIIGKWQLESEMFKGVSRLTPILDFKSDGNLVLSIGPANSDGTYKFISDDTMEVAIGKEGLSYPLPAKKVKVEIKGDEMTATDPDGKQAAAKFKKMP